MQWWSGCVFGYTGKNCNVVDIVNEGLNIFIVLQLTLLNVCFGGGMYF